MRRFMMLTLLFVVPSWAEPAQAQGLFFSRARANPTQRVPQLIMTVKTDTDEKKRAQAAEELQSFDGKTYAEVVPVLVDVAQHDQSASVRQQALSSLARIRPISPAAGQALEKAAAGDESWRIRLHAKSALLKYHLAGYASGGTTTAAASRNVTTAEPPLYEPPTATPAPSANQAPATARPSAALRQQTAEPPPLTIDVDGPSLIAPR
jgi:hypothetical protein